MTPANPDNSKPLIYRIADALGITHLVVAVQHSHLMSEITGLVDALAAKANAVHAGSPTGGIVIANTAGELSRSNKTLNDLMPVMTIDSTPTASSDNLVTSGGVAAALAAKMDNKTIDSTPTANSTNLVTSGGVAAALNSKAPINHIHYFIGEDTGESAAEVTASEDTVHIEVSNQSGGGECDITPSNIGNLAHALSDPDTVPTANSDKLVTSGGVATALADKANKVDVKYNVFEKSNESENIELDNVFSDGHEISHFVLINRMGEVIKVSEFFYTQYGELVENGHTLSNDSTAIVKIIHYADGSTIRFYMVVEEIFEA